MKKVINVEGLSLKEAVFLYRHFRRQQANGGLRPDEIRIIQSLKKRIEASISPCVKSESK